MKPTPKRQRSDSASAALTAHKNAALGPLKPPAHVVLREGDLPFWNAIVQARARDTWNDSDLSAAANMARCQADVERLQVLVDAEGFTINSASGVPIINPKHKLLETLSRRVVLLSRAIHVHAEATVGRSEDASKSLANERQAREAETDDLIPRLRAV